MSPVPSLGSLLAGLLFGVGWLIWIDGVAFAATEYDRHVDGAHYIPGIMSTIALFMLNLVQWEAITESESLLEDSSGGLAKCWVFSAFCLAFGGLIGTVWILVQQIHSPSWEVGSVGAATSGLLQNLFIFSSSLLFRISRTKSDA